METKGVEVASTNYREFVKALLALGKLGATLPDDEGVYKGIMLRTSVDVPLDAIVEESPVVRVQKHKIKKTETKKTTKAPRRSYKEEIKEEDVIEEEVKGE